MADQIFEPNFLSRNIVQDSSKEEKQLVDEAIRHTRRTNCRNMLYSIFRLWEGR